MKAADLDQRIRFEAPSTERDPHYGTPIPGWTEVVTVWAQVQDVAPSRNEMVKQGLAQARNQTRVRYRYRTDIDSSMRVTVLGSVERVLQIIGGPAELGRREFSEIVCESLSS